MNDYCTRWRGNEFFIFYMWGIIPILEFELQSWSSSEKASLTLKITGEEPEFRFDDEEEDVEGKLEREPRSSAENSANSSRNRLIRSPHKKVAISGWCCGRLQNSKWNFLETSVVMTWRHVSHWAVLACTEFSQLYWSGKWSGTWKAKKQR